MPRKSISVLLRTFWIAVCFTAQISPASAADGFKIFDSEFRQTSPAVAYNFATDEFLAVCGEARSGVTAVMGRFVKPDGSLSGPPFTICLNPGTYPSPAVAVNTDNQFLVVWRDTRNGNHDIYGARLDSKGKKLTGTNTLPDTTFVICDHDSSQSHPAAAFNFMDYCFLVVWNDSRNSRKGENTSYMVNSDVYGQRLNWDGNLRSPMNPPGTKVNFPVAANPDYDEYAQDVAYFGKDISSPSEWLVVYTKYSITGHYSPVWGVRVNGSDGYLLDTFGNKVEPGLFGKASGPLGGPPWFPHFPISFVPTDPILMHSLYHGSPHVESNAAWKYVPIPVQPRKTYPIPEYFVVWTDMAVHPSDIKGQRVALFPDSTAYRMNLKPARGTDGQFTAVLLDSLGKPPSPPAAWLTRPNHLICNAASAQSYNNIAYNPVEGEFLVLWNDWRAAGWNGGFPTGGPYIAPQADIYGQRIYLDPADLSLKYLDLNSVIMTDMSVNIPYAATSADDGNDNYPAAAWGKKSNHFLAVYEYDADAKDASIDIAGALLTGAPTAVGRDRGKTLPEGSLLAENYPNPLNPGTTIEFTLPSAGRTVVRVFNALGRVVAVLMDVRLEAGTHRVRWTGRDASGMEAPAGVYFVRIEAGPQRTTHKMALVR